MECKYCKKGCVKSGFSSSGLQRYICKSCNRFQQLEYCYRAYEIATENNIVVLSNESCGIRSISRILKISTVTVIRIIRKQRQKIKRPLLLFGREYELDEMRTYIGNKKKKYWIVYAIDKATREVVDFKVGRRTNKILSRVVDTLLLAKAKKIYTDNLINYKTLIPELIHRTGKRKINHIERKNLSVRTHLKRLSRKTICFSKNISMLEATLGIYFWKNSCSFI